MSDYMTNLIKGLYVSYDVAKRGVQKIVDTNKENENILNARNNIQVLMEKESNEYETHHNMFKDLFMHERLRTIDYREFSIVTYTFTSIMLGQDITRRNFSALNQLPPSYRTGKHYNKYLKDVEDEYYSELCSWFTEKKAFHIHVGIEVLKDLLTVKELENEVKEIISIREIFKNPKDRSRSVFSNCDQEEIKKHMRIAREITKEDAFKIDVINRWLKATEDIENKEYKAAIKQLMFGGKTKDEFDLMKIILIGLAWNKEQDEEIVALYNTYKSVCEMVFGFPVISKGNNDKNDVMTIYPSVDMVIAEVIRFHKSGITDQYNCILKDWLNICGRDVGDDQLDVLQQVFACLNAFEQEMIIIEFKVTNNIPRTEEQDQRLALLKESLGNNISLEHYIAKSENENKKFLYDYRFVSWKANDIEQYFRNMSLSNEKQKYCMVIDEWKKDVSLNELKWDIHIVRRIIDDAMHENYGDDYVTSIVEAGTVLADMDTFPSIYIAPKDKSIRNSDFCFLLTGEQITRNKFHLSIMTLIFPFTNGSNVNTNSEMCKKVIAVIEKHNPRSELFIETMKNILTEQIEKWINSELNINDIY